MALSLVLQEPHEGRQDLERSIHLRVDVAVRRVVPDHHQAFDSRVSQEEQLLKGAHRHDLRVGPSEQWLLEQPLVQHYLQADAVVH